MPGHFWTTDPLETAAQVLFTRIRFRPARISYAAVAGSRVKGRTRNSTWQRKESISFQEHIMAARKRRASAEYATKVFAEVGTIYKTAKRLGYSYVGAARLLYRLGLVRTKTSR